MSTRLNAGEFYAHLLENETVSGFFAREALQLDVPVAKLRAAYVSCKIENGKNVDRLGSLYQLYLDAPGAMPDIEDILGDKTPEDLGLRQKAHLNQRGKKYDESVTAADCIEDLMTMGMKDPLQYLTENYYMAHGAYHIDIIRAHFGTYLEFRRQAGLQLDRNQHKLQREIAKHVSLDVYRRFYDKEVQPYAGLYQIADKKNGRMKTVVIASDFHDTDADPFTLSVFLDTCKDMQPDYIVLNGDIFDEYEFSRFDIDPRGLNIKARFDYVKREIFAAVRAACPKSEIIFVIGNHDWRILRILAERTPNLKVVLSDVMGLTLADIFGVHDYNIHLVSKGDLDFAANTKGGVSQQLRKNFYTFVDQSSRPMYVAAHIKDYGFGISGTSGHVHKPGYDSFTNIHGKHSWMVTGCIAKTDAHYIEGLCKAQNGFGIVVLDTKTGEVDQQIVKVSSFAHVNGRMYYRKEE